MSAANPKLDAMTISRDVSSHQLVSLEPQAVVAGVVCAVAGAVFAVVALWGYWVSPWGGWSAGTAFEFAAFALIFAWPVLSIRFVGAMRYALEGAEG